MISGFSGAFAGWYSTKYAPNAGLRPATYSWFGSSHLISRKMENARQLVQTTSHFCGSQDPTILGWMDWTLHKPCQRGGVAAVKEPKSWTVKSRDDPTEVSMTSILKNCPPAKHGKWKPARNVEVSSWEKHGTKKLDFPARHVWVHLDHPITM